MRINGDEKGWLVRIGIDRVRYFKLEIFIL